MVNDCVSYNDTQTYFQAKHVKVKYWAFRQSTEGFYVESVIYLRMLETKVDADDAGFDSAGCVMMLLVPRYQKSLDRTFV